MRRTAGAAAIAMSTPSRPRPRSALACSLVDQFLAWVLMVDSPAELARSGYEHRPRQSIHGRQPATRVWIAFQEWVDSEGVASGSMITERAFRQAMTARLGPGVRGRRDGRLVTFYEMPTPSPSVVR
jgi:hypothetical protein